VERQFFDVDGSAVEYEFAHGEPDSPTLVFLHEGLGSIDLWRGVPGEIAAACGGARVLVYARHGYGASGPARMPRPVGYMHHEADRVLPELLAGLRIERPVLVGHSDGASIALLHAGAGGSVAGLVCLAPHVFVEDETIAGIEAAREAFATTDLPAKLGRYHRDPVAAFRGWNDVWLDPAFRAWDITERLPRIDAPVLVVQGTADDYGTVAQVDAIEAGVSGRCGRLVLDGVGHAPHLEARDAVVAAVAAFVGSLSG
jgi:pimeloyl-ACP methyl ester carboxylesterase